MHRQENWVSKRVSPFPLDLRLLDDHMGTITQLSLFQTQWSSSYAKEREMEEKETTGNLSQTSKDMDEFLISCLERLGFHPQHESSKHLERSAGGFQGLQGEGLLRVWAFFRKSDYWLGKDNVKQWSNCKNVKQNWGWKDSQGWELKVGLRGYNMQG